MNYEHIVAAHPVLAISMADLREEARDNARSDFEIACDSEMVDDHDIEDAIEYCPVVEDLRAAHGIPCGSGYYLMRISTNEEVEAFSAEYRAEWNRLVA